MEHTADITDNIKNRIFELQNLAKCLFTIIDCNINNNKEYNQILPLAKIINKKTEALSDNYEILENKIYKKLLFM